MKKLDGQLQRYILTSFNPQNVKNYSNMLQKYFKALSRHPQRWRLEALAKDGHLETECETVEMDAEGGSIGASASEDGNWVTLESDRGDIADTHCAVQCLGGHFYSWDQGNGSRIDGKKYGNPDGPVPLRDGSTMAIGRYLLFVEVGGPEWLRARRLRLLKGESPWGKAAEVAPGAAEDDAAAEEADEAEEGEEEEEEGGAEDAEAQDAEAQEGE